MAKELGDRQQQCPRCGLSVDRDLNAARNNLEYPSILDRFPVIGAAVWAAILATAPARRPEWSLMPSTFRGTILLLALVTTAAMMPVEKLPAASWEATLGLGFLSAVFDNIPLTALALHQGGYDWGFLAYAVGFGGSMIWFGSSAGVALSNAFPESRSVGKWLRHGWHVAPAYVGGAFSCFSRCSAGIPTRSERTRRSLCPERHTESSPPVSSFHTGMRVRRTLWRPSFDFRLLPLPPPETRIGRSIGAQADGRPTKKALSRAPIKSI